ncbi:NUDIX domain-containing protein [Reinekea blandensis]|uniref:Putative MutT family protein n=1 Tax=Reinekea blandensis MED297 TaxID=314283 RepID=A4BCB7_9GAMM|nr:NUDIX domain-containing protein [Reinekea blandensis]EAR10183.1 putative MutT family protein [Reinekea sp. MED297] [Reinekea blandensis MED297]
MEIAQIKFKKGNHVLLGYRQNVQAENERWGFPSGKLEPGEMPLDAAIREAKEEVGVDTHELDHLFSLIDYKGNKHHFFLCLNWSGELVNAESELCREVSWFPLNRLPGDSTHITFTAVKELKNELLVPTR